LHIIVIHCLELHDNSIVTHIFVPFFSTLIVDFYDIIKFTQFDFLSVSRATITQSAIDRATIARSAIVARFVKVWN